MVLLNDVIIVFVLSHLDSVQPSPGAAGHVRLQAWYDQRCS